MKFPARVLEAHPTDAHRQRVGYLIRFAALQHNEDGSIPVMADAIGVSQGAVYAALDRGYVSQPMAAAIELLVGVDVISRDMFKPVPETSL